MLLVKGHLAVAVRHLRGGAGGRGRSSTVVHDRDSGRESNAPAACADGGAEINVFGVHEVPLVEEPDGLCISSSNEEARAADPVGGMRAACPPLHECRDHANPIPV